MIALLCNTIAIEQTLSFYLTNNCVGYWAIYAWIALFHFGVVRYSLSTFVLKTRNAMTTDENDVSSNNVNALNDTYTLTMDKQQKCKNTERKKWKRDGLNGYKSSRANSWRK